MLFFDVKQAAEVRLLLDRPTREPAVETVELRMALHRVCAADVCCPEDLPPFDRSAVDGYAVRAADTFGASASLPAYLQLGAEVRMGGIADLPIQPGQAAYVPTGGMIPPGADAVVMVEQTSRAEGGVLEVVRPGAPGEHLIRAGDDARAGEVVVPAGRRLSPQHLGALASLGLTEIDVFVTPQVAIIPTGDELVAPNAEPGPGQIRDINSTALAGAVVEAGGEPELFEIVRDQPERLRGAIDRARRCSSLVLVAGGSSVGERDWTLQVMMESPGAELLVHGVAIRPGKPLIVVACGEALLVGLPGNPISALIVFNEFIAPYLRRLGGETGERPPRACRARLTRSISSEPGKEDYIRVRLTRSAAGWIAEPLLGKSSLLRTLVQADGLVTLPAGLTGIEEGAEVDVVLC